MTDFTPFEDLLRSPRGLLEDAPFDRWLRAQELFAERAYREAAVLLTELLDDPGDVVHAAVHISRARIDREPMPCREVVEHRHLVTAVEQPPGADRADIAGPTGDQEPHIGLAADARPRRTRSTATAAPVVRPIPRTIVTAEARPL